MMQSLLSSASLILLIIFLVIGIVMVPFTLPGTWVIAIAALVYSLVRDFQSSSDWIVVGILAGLAVVGEILEFLLGTLGAKKEKVPTGAIICSVIGGIIGALIGVPVFLIGAVLGLLLGTFVGALAYCLVKDGNVAQALRHARAILTSRVISIFAKTSVAVGMAVYVLFKVF